MSHIKPKKKGFTLVELLIVTVVIGILSVITAGTFRSYLDNTHDTKKTSLSADFRKALDSLATEDGTKNYASVMANPFAVLDQLEENSFGFSVLDTECIWVGVNTVNTNEAVYTFLQKQDGTLKVIKNSDFSVSITVPATSCDAPTATNWDFWSLDSSRRICDDSSGTACCAFYTGSTPDTSGCS